MRCTRGGSAHRPPPGEGAPGSSFIRAPGPSPGPQSPPEPAPGARLSRGARPRAQRTSPGPSRRRDSPVAGSARPAPPVPRSAPPRAGSGTPHPAPTAQATPTARLSVPRGHLEPCRLRSSLASGPDPHQGTLRRRISSDFSASGPAALQVPQGVS
ncbi:hypothetical protein NDU88_006463 [Pleurodeles waltl]|uniref:Uncharacterized protein n=1 Tax=Pleurodeles waltl TaxID=8319 RepID=A0AAV7RNX8_PLEWA|nr:hypothetical protein NDU88_006463 [Pleurodeles waltl]